jgi:hypothetical protein
MNLPVEILEKIFKDIDYSVVSKINQITELFENYNWEYKRVTIDLSIITIKELRRILKKISRDYQKQTNKLANLSNDKSADLSNDHKKIKRIKIICSFEISREDILKKIKVLNEFVIIDLFISVNSFFNENDVALLSKHTDATINSQSKKLTFGFFIISRILKKQNPKKLIIDLSSDNINSISFKKWYRWCDKIMIEYRFIHSIFSQMTFDLFIYSNRRDFTVIDSVKKLIASKMLKYTYALPTSYHERYFDPFKFCKKIDWVQTLIVYCDSFSDKKPYFDPRIETNYIPNNLKYFRLKFFQVVDKYYENELLNEKNNVIRYIKKETKDMKNVNIHSEEFINQMNNFGVFFGDKLPLDTYYLDDLLKEFYSEKISFSKPPKIHSSNKKINFLPEEKQVFLDDIFFNN